MLEGQFTSSERFRGTIPPEQLDMVPVESRDLDQQGRIHWAQPVGQQDPFVAGALWALGWSLEKVFGPIAGGLLEDLTLTNVERWNGSQWVPVA